MDLYNEGQGSLQSIQALQYEPAAPEQEQFVRREEKLFLPNSLREDFLKLVRQNLSPAYPDPTTEFTLIESLYLDTRDLRSFRDHFSGVLERFKLRTRRYGPNGIWAPDADAVIYVELKMKHGEISDKLRMKLKGQDRLRLLSGGVLRGTPKKLAVAEKINELILNDRPVPMCRVRYRRFAFEDNGLRVTVDDQLQSVARRNITPELKFALKAQPWFGMAASMLHDFSPGDVSLIEVKHHGFIPPWLREFMAQNQLPFRSFSKYCYSIAKQL